jgi:DNA-binding PadR family transcriptional regulator
MMRDTQLDEVFEQFLPSASNQEMEASRSRVLARVRANIAAGRETVEATFVLNNGDYHILLALENGERHAYAIMSDVEELTEGATRFGPGTLFTSIERLLTAGLIEETQKHTDPRVNDEPRQYYQLTEAGLKALAMESKRLAARLFHLRGQEMMRCL